MGNFNEIQKGMPDLGKTYWQELHNNNSEKTEETDIVKMNCQTIFDPAEKIKLKVKNNSVFKQ